MARLDESEYEEQAVTAFVVTWDAGSSLLTTNVRRALSVGEVAEYECALSRVIAAISDETSFGWLSDATGYEALANRAAHEAFRAIVPRTLAEHGFRTSLLDIVDGELSITCTRGVACVAIAHVHHEVEKMLVLDQRFSRDDERYFSDEGEARTWLVERTAVKRAARAAAGAASILRARS